MSVDYQYDLVQRLLLDSDYRNSFIKSVFMEAQRRHEHVLSRLMRGLADGDAAGVPGRELAELIPGFLRWTFLTDQSPAYHASRVLLGQFLRFLHETRTSISIALLKRLVRAEVSFPAHSPGGVTLGYAESEERKGHLVIQLSFSSGLGASTSVDQS
jgi:hypothetical protein